MRFEPRRQPRGHRFAVRRRILRGGVIGGLVRRRVHVVVWLPGRFHVVVRGGRRVIVGRILVVRLSDLVVGHGAVVVWVPRRVLLVVGRRRGFVRRGRRVR
jgi:hypothetical protein